MHRFVNVAAVLGLVLFAGNAQDGDNPVHDGPRDSGTASELTESAQEDLPEALLEHAAAALAVAIRESRTQALDRGVDPIPVRIRAALEPYFPAQILDKARWTMAGGISLDGLLKSWFYLDGAVTFGEVVAFSDAMEAQQDIELWAHELTHVVQYETRGIDTFASDYLRDFNGMESEASSNASRIMASIGTGKGSSP
jgi:hypothetical protein